MLNRCRSDNKSKDTHTDDDNYCITYNYEFLEDYKVEEDSGFDGDNLSSLGSNGRDDDDDDKPE